MSNYRDAQAILTIDLDTLADNWRLLAARVAPAECGAVVKADAYGTGIERAVPALARAGCRTFFVAHAAEGMRARASLRDAGYADIETRLFVLNGFHPDATPPQWYADAALSGVLGSARELAAWSRLFSEVRHLSCAIHVDTGMNRLGFDPEEAQGFDHATLAGCRAEVLMSHLVAAEEPGNWINGQQIARFEDVRRGVLGVLRGSLANSSGIFLEARPHYDLVRPGYALFGGNPTPGWINPMRPVVGLTAQILQTRWIEPGEPAGYNGRWVAQRRTQLATIGVGYADGLPRNARTLGGGDGPCAWVGDTLCPLVGRVSMDLSLVDVTDARSEAARPGASIELLGSTITVDDLGGQTGTIGYEILTGLGRRYRRHYRDAARIA